MTTEIQSQAITSPMQVILPILKKQVNRAYKVGDSLESVAYRQGQLDLIRFIEEKIMHQNTQQGGGQHGIPSTFKL